MDHDWPKHHQICIQITSHWFVAFVALPFCYGTRSYSPVCKGKYQCRFGLSQASRILLISLVVAKTCLSRACFGINDAEIEIGNLSSLRPGLDVHFWFLFLLQSRIATTLEGSSVLTKYEDSLETSYVRAYAHVSVKNAWKIIYSHLLS